MQLGLQLAAKSIVSGSKTKAKEKQVRPRNHFRDSSLNERDLK